VADIKTNIFYRSFFFASSVELLGTHKFVFHEAHMTEKEFHAVDQGSGRFFIV